MGLPAPEPAAELPLAQRMLPALRSGASGRQALAAALLVVVVASPWFGVPSWTTTVAATAVFTGIAATGVSMMLGQAGLLTLGAAFFSGFGGYGAALIGHYSSVPTAAAIVLSAIGTAIVAIPLGLLLVRMPRFYFAVATLGLAIALAGVIAALPGITGGASGMAGGGSLDFGVVSVTGAAGWYVTGIVAFLVVLLVKRSTTRGRRLPAYALLRQDELAAGALGIPVTRMKVQMFAVAAGVLALSGGLLFAMQGVVVPDDAGVTQSVQLIGIAVVGGMTSEYGGLAGAAVLLWLQSLLSGFSTVELLIYGAVFVVVVMFFGDGLVGMWKLAWRRIWGLTSARRGGLEEAMAGFAPGTRASAVAQEVAGRVGHLRGALGGHRTGIAVGATGVPSSAILEVAGVSLAFGGVRAVDDATLVVPGGEVTTLIGHNGAGKSTLLNIISGFERPDRGSVRLGGHPIDHLSPARRTHLGLARSFQVPRLIEGLDVLGNVMLGAQFSDAGGGSEKGRRTDARARSWELLEHLGLTSIANQVAGTLSGGHRKQVELARALVSRPVALVLDEPGVGLDAQDIAKVTGVLRAAARAGAAVLVVDHNIDFVESVATSIWSMELGRVTLQRRIEDADRRRPGETAESVRQ